MRLQDKIAINNMRHEGHSPSVIAAKLGLPAGTVSPISTATQASPEPKSAKTAASR